MKNSEETTRKQRKDKVITFRLTQFAEVRKLLC